MLRMIGSQKFEINASGNARVDADSSGAVDIQTRLTQLTDECDGSPTSTCFNDGRTNYFVDAGSNAFVDLSTPQGLDMTQQNVDCDNGVDCTNDAFQDIVIGANEFTTGSAFVDFETDDSFSDLVERNECEITNGGNAFSCLNEYDTSDFLAEINAEDNSRVDVDSFGQDSTQVNDCTNAGAAGCTNDMGATDFFDINTAGNAIVNVDGGTDTSQTNDCSDGAECVNSIMKIWIMI